MKTHYLKDSYRIVPFFLNIADSPQTNKDRFDRSQIGHRERKNQLDPDLEFFPGSPGDLPETNVDSSVYEDVASSACSTNGDADQVRQHREVVRQPQQQQQTRGRTAELLSQHSKDCITIISVSPAGPQLHQNIRGRNNEPRGGRDGSLNRSGEILFFLACKTKTVAVYCFV